jgi:hypothetical protein
MTKIKTILAGSAAIAALAISAPTSADQVFLDDLIVDGSACIGMDCANGENFGSDTLRLKENNLRIHFDDTSSTGSFPSNDWRIQINDSTNGGASYFGIQDATAGNFPVRIKAGAGANALVVDDNGFTGFGTLDPTVTLHVVDGNTPTLRLEQDGSSGFASRTWDLAGNETNFFLRDVNSSSDLPFRVFPGTGDDELVLRNGRAGFGTDNPSVGLHVTGAAGDALLLLDENSTTSSKRDMITLNNLGNP